MERLGVELRDMINTLGEDRSLSLLTESMTGMQFRINFDSINSRLQNYINLSKSDINVNGCLVKNVIITSPTQVGKTQYIIENCKKNKNRSCIFIITCDNSKSQMHQLYNRLFDNGIESFDLKKASNAKVENILMDGEAVFIIMMNNKSQISKLETLVNSLRVRYRPSQYIVFHDEGDTVNKADSDVEIDDLGVPLSHRRWLSFFNTLSVRGEIVKRFWVTATPENCSTISKITGDDIVVLPIPRNYVSISENIDWDGELCDKIGYEVERIRSSMNREVILYCVDRKKSIHSQLAVDISIKYNCVCFSYNGDGFTIYRGGNLMNIGLSKKDDISSVLDKLRDSGPIVVVGYNLMDRGISFVAGPNSNNGYSRENLPPTATVMFYTGSVGSHVVGIAQRFGRICGTSRPDIRRRVVYCNPGVYSDYVGYLENQKSVFSRLEMGRDKTMCEILKNSGVGVKLRRSLDRPGLKIVNLEYSSSDSGSNSGSDWDENKMHRLVDSWRVVINNTAIARVFREMVGCGGKMKSCIVRGMISGQGPYDAMTSTHANKWDLIFRKEGRYHYIRDEVLGYLG